MYNVHNTHVTVHALWYMLQELTSCSARRGMYSMIASRTLHLLSSASSTMAGRREVESWLMPITACNMRDTSIMTESDEYEHVVSLCVHYTFTCTTVHVYCMYMYTYTMYMYTVCTCVCTCTLFVHVLVFPSTMHPRECNVC